MTNLQPVFASFCATIKRHILLRIWPNYVRRLQWSVLQNFLKLAPGLSILDIGAGNLEYSVRMSRNKSVNVTALDLTFSEALKQYGRKKGITMITADANALPFPDQSFERILMSSMLHMVPNPESILKECERVLKPGGILVISVPNRYQWIPTWLGSIFYQTIAVPLGLPKTMQSLELAFNQKFSVLGPQGYYSLPELYALIGKGALNISRFDSEPKGNASLLWEAALLAYLKIGNLAFHLLFIMYPIAYMANKLSISSIGSEHILQIEKQDA